MSEQSEFICPREGNQCSHCELIARTAFMDTFDYYSEGGNPPGELRIQADNAKLHAKLEENVINLSCEKRQRLAFMIGHEAGQRVGAREAARKHGFEEDIDDE